jgi:hypothetical protein
MWGDLCEEPREELIWSRWRRLGLRWKDLALTLFASPIGMAFNFALWCLLGPWLIRGDSVWITFSRDYFGEDKIMERIHAIYAIKIALDTLLVVSGNTFVVEPTAMPPRLCG